MSHICDSSCNVIYRPYITRGGKRIYRSDGKMWPIHLKDKAA